MSVLQKSLTTLTILVSICMSVLTLPALASPVMSEMVFIDSAVQDARLLADGVRPGAEVVLLDAGRDGVEQIGEVLAQRRGLQAIHVISHGAPGRVFLGTAVLSADNLEQYAMQLKAAAGSLDRDGEILFYGCDIARGTLGRGFVQEIASLTSSIVSASTDVTGSALLGGNWILEESGGKSAAKTILGNAVRETYMGVLASGTITFTNSTGFTGAPANTAADGQGGSADIAGIIIEVYGIDSSALKLTSSGALEFHSADWGVPAIVTFSGTGSYTTTGTYGMAIKASGGTDFKLTSLNFFDWGNWDGHSWTIEALENGNSKGTRTFNGNTAGNYIALAQGGVLSSDFDNIDEIRIYNTNGSGSWFGINDIVIDNPVVPNVAPVISNLNGDIASYVEGASAVHLDSGSASVVSDGDSADFNGGSITVAITVNGVVGEDVLGIDTSGSVSLSAGITVGSHVLVSGVDIGTISANGSSGNNLVVDFNSNATPSRVTTLMVALTYRNSNGIAPNTATRTISVTVNDGDGGSSSAASVSVAVVGVNDPPSLSATGGTLTYTEDGLAVDLYSLVSISAMESVQTITGLTLTVGNLADGINEIMRIDGSDIALVNGASGTTIGGKAVNYNVSVSGSTATVTLSKGGGLSAADAQTVVDGISYLNSSENPNSTSRVITLTSITDNGGTGNGGMDTTSLSVVATLAITAVNDAPTITAPVSIGVTEDVAGTLTGISFDDVDAGNGTVTATLSVGSGVLVVTGSGVSVTGSGTGFMTLSGSIAEINTFIAAGYVTFTTAGNADGNVTLNIGIGDGGNTGSGGAKTAAATVTLAVAAVNDPPAVSAPVSISVTEDVETALTGIGFSDVDAAGASVTATLGVDSGTLTAASGGGVAVGGSGSSMLTLAGSVTDINAFIAAGKVHFTTAANATADVILSITINDGGNSGSGGAKTGSGSTTLLVTAVNDAPRITNVRSASSFTQVGSVGFSAGQASYTSLAVNASGTPYLAYMDGGNGNRATLMRYNGSSWSPVGTAGFSAGQADYTTLAIDAGGTPYVAYRDGGNASMATLMKYDGSSWLPVGNSGFSAGSVLYTSLAIDGGNVPYVTYMDGGNGYRATVMKFDGVAWQTVGSAGFSAGQVEFTTLAINGSGVPYVAFNDYGNSNRATVMKYDGGSWVTVGSAGFSAGQADYTSIAIDGSGVPYVAYKDYANSNKATVMKFDGVAWQTVGSAGFSAGQADYIRLAINGSGEAYVAYRDGGTSNKATVMKFYGGSWVTVGSAGLSPGQASYTSLAFAGSVPYVAYMDGASVNRASVKALTAGPIVWNAAENQTAAGVITASDAESASLTYSITGGLDQSRFSIGAASGVITFKSAPNYELPGDSDFNNVYKLTVQVSDGSGSDSANVEITVTNVNEAPVLVLNGGLTLNQDAAQTTINNTRLLMTDIDGPAAGTLVYTLTAVPSKGTLRKSGVALGIGDSFSQADVTGSLISFTPDGSQNGADSFSFTYSDGIVAPLGPANFAITITDNIIPTVTSVTVPGNATYVAGQNLDFTVNLTENVTVTGADSTLGLTIGVTARTAAQLSTTGNSITYRYTVQSGDIDNDGITVGTLTLNTTTIRDAAANNANTTLNSVGSTAAVLVDTLVPVATAAGSVTTTGFNANWGSVTGASGYYLDVSTDSGFGSFIAGYNNLDAGNVTTYAVSGLTASSTYYYRVRAYNSGGVSANSNSITLLPRFTVTPSAGAHGSIDPATAQPVLENGSATFTLTPDTGYHLDTISGSCGGTLTGNSYTTSAITADCSVIASFAINTYTITTNASGNGAITCATPIDHGAASACNISIDPGYRLTALTSNGSDILGSVTLDQLTITNITETLTVTATFSPASHGGQAITGSDTGPHATVHAADGTQHLVYERNGTLYYRNSSGISGNWSAEETVTTGQSPAIALGSDGVPRIACLTGGQLLTTARTGGAWSTPEDTGISGANTIEIALDGNGKTHLAYTKTGSDGYDDIHYTNNISGAYAAPATICDGAYSGGNWTFCRTPQIQADNDGNYHIAYNKQQINSALSAHDPQWMIYTTNANGGSTISSHDLNPGAGTGTPQLLVRGSFGHDPLHGYTLTYGNDMEAAGLWLAEDLQNGNWTETAAAIPGNAPSQGNNDTAQTRHLAYLAPDGRIMHTARTASGYSALTELAPGGSQATVNPIKRSILYRLETNGTQQLFQVGIDALAILTPMDGNLGTTVPGQTVEKQYTLTNNGSQPLTPSEIKTGLPGYTFEIGTDNCSGITIAPGGTCTFTVRNSHQTYPIVVTDTLTITSDDPLRGTITLPLSLQVLEYHYPLAITMNGSGTVTATAAAQSNFICTSGTCSRDYDTNSIVTLTAQTPVGYTFTGFTFTGDGSACCRETSCSFTITGNTDITAAFVRNSYPISTLTVSNGTLICTTPVSHGDQGICTVTPDPGYRIEGIGGSCGGTLNGNSYTTLPVTAGCTVGAVFAAAPQRSVTVTTTGTGAGTVYSAPAGIICPLGACTAQFDDSTVTTLSAVPDTNSTFGGWSGACSNTAGPCDLTLTEDREVTATFTAAPNAKVSSTGHATLTQAYAGTSNGATIKARAITFIENLVLNGNHRVTLEGGYNAEYDCNSCGGNTILKGTMTIEHGSVIMENIIIR